jgi:hypothetical protein
MEADKFEKHLDGKYRECINNKMHIHVWDTKSFDEKVGVGVQENILKALCDDCQKDLKEGKILLSKQIELCKLMRKLVLLAGRPLTPGGLCSEI